MLKWFCFIALLVNCGALTLPLNDETVKFTFNGIEHTESRRVEGNIVTLTDVMDGFLVTFDYGRDILMIKNMTSQTCFFSRLENVPIQKGDTTAMMVKEVTTYADSDDLEKVLFFPAGIIPSSYVLLTNDVTVAGECVSQPSYWLETKVGTRQRRGGCDCDLVLGVIIGVLLVG